MRTPEQSACVVELIKTTSTRGRGTSADPVRIITQYWTLEGDFLFEFDPLICAQQSESEVRNDEGNRS